MCHLLIAADSPDNNSCQDGGYNLGFTNHHGKPASLSASPERRVSESLSPHHKSAKRGMGAAPSESLSSLESEWASPPASQSVGVETCPELIDRSLQTGTSFCHTDQWVQTSPMMGFPGTAALSPGDKRLPGKDLHDVLSVSVGLSPFGKSSLIYFESDDDLRRHYVFGHHNDSLTDDAKEEHLGLYAENLEDYQNFQHGVLFDEHHHDSQRYDQGSVVKSGSQLMSLSSRSAASPVVSTINRSGRDRSITTRSLDRIHNQASKYSSVNMMNSPDNILASLGNSLDVDEPDGSFEISASNSKFGHGSSVGASDKNGRNYDNSESQVQMTKKNGQLSGGGMSRDNSVMLSYIKDDDVMTYGDKLSEMTKTSLLADASLLASVGKSNKDTVDSVEGKSEIDINKDNVVQELEKEGEVMEKENPQWIERGEFIATVVRERNRKNSWAEELEKYRVQSGKLGKCIHFMWSELLMSSHFYCFFASLLFL